jgi:hypothetical protein
MVSIHEGTMSLARFVCQAVKLNPEKWEMYKEVVADSIRVRRANCNSSVKKEYHGKPVST